MKQTSKSKRRSNPPGKTLNAWQPEILNADESAEAEQIDRLLFSSLRLWEIEREMIAEGKEVEIEG